MGWILQLISEGEFVNDKKNGLHRKWYENGQLKSEGNYNNGNRNGLNRTWYGNGNIKRIGELKNDVWIGTIKVYTEKGLLRSIVKTDGEFLYEHNILNDKKFVFKYINGEYIEIN